MPDHLRSLLVILALAGVTFVLAQAPANNLATAPGEFERRRNLWLGLTLAAFLAHNYWLFVLIAGILLYVTSQRDQNRIGLVMFVLLAVPPMRAEIPGFGIIRYFFDMDYLRLIALAVLLPAFLQEKARTPWKQFTGEISDKLLLSYLALNLGLIVLVSTLTGTLRTAFLMFLDVVLPYLMASRLTRSVDSVRSACSGYVVGAALLASIGIFEAAKQWLLYNTLDEALGLSWDYGSYLRRDESLRAMGTAGQAIPFGYAMAVGFCLMLGLRRFIPQRPVWLAGLALLAMGTVASFSRGPWIGAAAGFLVFVFMGQHKARNLFRLILAAILLAPVVLASPLGEKILYSITVESESYLYRQRLLEISIGVILANPFFGAFDYIYSPAMQELKQGQGIIDIVNTYLAVGLGSGLVGLSLFTAFFLSVWFGVWNQMRRMADKHGEAYELGRALLAALTCVLVTIFSVSSITVIPVIYYLLTGVAIGYVRSVRAAAEGLARPRSPVSPPSGTGGVRVAAVSR